MESKTNILQPTFHSNSRTEFRIGTAADKVISSAIRICNFGVQSYTAAAGGGLAYYNLGTGIYGCIKQITLYSGGVILDELKDASRWLGMSNLVGQTDSAWDVRQKMICSGLNLRHDELVQSPSQLQLQLQQSKLIGRLMLPAIFPMLSAVPNGLLVGFNDIRVVIEYNTDLTQIFQAVGMPTLPVFNQPVLVYDELVNADGGDLQVPTTPSAWEYLAIEREVINIPATLADTPQTTSIRLRGVDQKQVSNLYLQVLPTGVADAQLGYGYSSNMPTGDDKINFVLNSKRLLPQNGFNTAARKAASMADKNTTGFGAFTLSHDVPSSPANINIHNGVYDAQLQAMFNKLAFVSCDIQEVVNQLDLEYYRPGVAAGSDALTIYVWYRVSKTGSCDGKGNVSTMYEV